MGYRYRQTQEVLVQLRTLAVDVVERDVSGGESPPDPELYANFRTGEATKQLREIGFRAVYENAEGIEALGANHFSIISLVEPAVEASQISLQEVKKAYSYPEPNGDLSARWSYVVAYTQFALSLALIAYVDFGARPITARNLYDRSLDSVFLEDGHPVSKNRASMLELGADIYDELAVGSAFSDANTLL